MATSRWLPIVFTGARTGVVLAALVLPHFAAEGPESALGQAAQVVARATGGVITACPKDRAAGPVARNVACIRSPGAPHQIVGELDASLRNRWEKSWRSEQYREVPVNGLRHQGQLLTVSAERAGSGTLVRLHGLGRVAGTGSKRSRESRTGSEDLPVIAPLAPAEGANGRAPGSGAPKERPSAEAETPDATGHAGARDAQRAVPSTSQRPLEATLPQSAQSAPRPALPVQNRAPERGTTPQPAQASRPAGAPAPVVPSPDTKPEHPLPAPDALGAPPALPAAPEQREARPGGEQTPAPTQPERAGIAPLARTLALNEPRQHGEDVRILQNRLIEVAGMPRGTGGDGWYGPTTEMTVKAFQQANGLSATGVVDRATWERLFSPEARPFTVRAAEPSAETEQSVEAPAPAPDATSGEAAAEPAAAGQEASSERTDLADPFVRELSLTEPRTNGEDVRKVQNRLMDVAGMPRGPGGDGWYGPRTQATVRAFQEANRLPVTGVVDRATWERLFSPEARAFARQDVDTPY